MNTKRRKLKPNVLTMIYTFALILLVGAAYMIQNTYNNKSLRNTSSEDTVDVTPNGNERPIDPNGRAEIPVVSTDTQIIRPYSDSNVKIVNNYYDYRGTNEEQENSILYYEDTYMQNSGVDYAIDDKSSFDVISILDGTVSSISEDDILGKIVEVKFSNDLMGIYQSMGEINVKVDDTVIQGSVIGTSGESNIGKDLGNHLHFELYYQGKVVNPEEYFGKLLGEI